MSGPTPGELARLAAKAREWAADFKAETWQELYVGDEEEIEDGADCDDANRIADLLDAYPLPAPLQISEEDLRAVFEYDPRAAEAGLRDERRDLAEGLRQDIRTFKPEPGSSRHRGWVRLIALIDPDHPESLPGHHPASAAAKVVDLPAAGGERERLAAGLAAASDALEALEWAGPLDCDQCVGEPAPCCILCGATKGEGHFSECGAGNSAQVRATAVLLRAPAAQAASGARQGGDVREILKMAAREAGELEEAIRALPEAAPLQPWGYGIVDADGDICLSENCVAADPNTLQEEVIACRKEEEGLRVVRLFWAELERPAKAR